MTVIKNLIYTLFVSLLAAACYDRDKNTDNANGDGENENDSESDDQNVAPSEGSFITIETCIASCEFEFECGLMADIDATTDMCAEMCPLSVDLMRCLYGYYSPACQVAYKAYFDCFYTIDNCNDLDNLMNGFVSNADTESASTSDVCQAEVEEYTTCMEEMDDQLTEDICEEELNAYAEFWDDEMLPGDTETTDTGIGTQELTYQKSFNHLIYPR